MQKTRNTQKKNENNEKHEKNTKSYNKCKIKEKNVKTCKKT